MARNTQDGATEKGYNKSTLEFIMKCTENVKNRPRQQGRLKGDPVEMGRLFDEYVQLCLENDRKIGNMAAYAAMGITPQDAQNWFYNANHPCHDLIVRVKSMCTAYREQVMSDGKINPAVGIFQAKNFDGMTDVQQHVNVKVNALDMKADLATLEKRYESLPTIEHQTTTIPELGTVDILEGEVVE